MKKILILPSLIMVLGLSLIIGGICCNKIPGQELPTQEKKELLHQCTDERGLISVIFRDGKDTFALDYLTEHEMDSVFGIAEVPYFNDKQILLPDYVCADTLIVTDYKGLNRGMAYYEQGYFDAGDYEIDSVLHCSNKQGLAHCMTFGQYVEHLDGEGYRQDIALHIALVDFGRIPADKLYESIIND